MGESGRLCRYEGSRFPEDEFVTVGGLVVHRREPLHTVDGDVVGSTGGLPSPLRRLTVMTDYLSGPELGGDRRGELKP